MSTWRNDSIITAYMRTILLVEYIPMHYGSDEFSGRCIGCGQDGVRLIAARHGVDTTLSGVPRTVCPLSHAGYAPTFQYAVRCEPAECGLA